MIYLDNAATTKMFDCCTETIKKYYSEQYFNPSAVYEGAIIVRNELDRVRNLVAGVLRVNSENIFFTSGGTEGDNMSVFGSAVNKSVGKIICSACEHPAVFNCFSALKNKGFNVEIIPCNKNGTVNIEKYKESVMADNVAFASIMHVNNETGGINDIAMLSKMLKQYNPDAIFHSDGVQAFEKVQISLRNSDIDLYSFSSHKINGPKGVGAIYVNRPERLNTYLFGGGQEKGIRSGTENTAGIIAFGDAVKIWNENRKEYLERFSAFRTFIIDKLKPISEISYNTDVSISSPHILSLNIGGIKGEVLLHMLEDKGIYIGRGSACSTKETSPRALKALSVNGEGTIRISFGAFNTMPQIEEFCEVLIVSINQLRTVMR